MITLKKSYLIILATIMGQVLFAQNKEEDQAQKRPLNGIYMNILGEASAISLEYERLFLIKPKMVLSCRLGLGYNEEFEFFDFFDDEPKRYLTLPHVVTCNFGKRRSFFEIGLGGTAIIGNTPRHYYLYPVAGYRFMPLKSKKAYFRVYISIPTVGYEATDLVFFPIGAGIGLSL